MLDSVPQSSQLYSFVILCNIFRPTYDTSEKYQTLTDEMKYDLRSAFLRGLLFEQPEIYNQAAYLVSLIIVIDNDLSTVLEILDFLRDLLINGEHQESAHYAAITALQEIYSSEHVINIYNKFDPSDPTFVNVLIQQKNDFIEFMKNGYNYPTTFITEVIKSLEYFIDNIDIKPVLKDIEEELNIFFEIFELMLPQVIEVDLYRSIFRLMYCLVGKFYGSPALDIEKVIFITTNGIICSNPDFVVISIDFWDCIATQEIKRKKNNFIYERCQQAAKIVMGKSNYMLLDEIIKPKESDCDYLISFASESISNVLNVLTQIDPSNQDAENQSDVETPSEVAVSLINKVFKVSHEGMFNKISELYEVGVTSEDWTIQNAFLLVLSSLSSENIYDEVVELFQRSAEFIVNCALSTIDRLTDSAIFVLSVIAKDYSIYSIGLEMPQILEIISSLLSRNVLIATKSLSLLQHIIKDRRTPVDEYFTVLKDLVLGTLDRDDFVSNANLDFEYPPFITVFQTLRLIIERCTDDSIDEIKSLLVDFILQNLYELSEGFQSQEITNSMEQCLLQTMTVIFKNFHENLKDKSGEILDLLFELIQKMNSEVTEDILRVITHIISALDFEKLDRFKPKIMEYIEFTLSSNSPSIIKNSIIVIANFFDKNAILVMDILPVTIDLIMDCFNNQYFTPDFYPDVAKNLSFIIEAISTSSMLKFVINCSIFINQCHFCPLNLKLITEMSSQISFWSQLCLVFLEF